ncbi:hypothetical protein [uncultured Sphingomonas sp.]|uniref:hypothetical protein n=1 Tax=uncultured Sphingomonas sp. TaxID=158754 RepID=UPI0025FF5E29|nr:hypothetical protein [uncultured Sphingomonas sp.]
MRTLLLPFAAVALGAPAEPIVAPTPVTNMPVVNPLQQPADCPETPMSLARKQAERPQAIPLDQLPEANMFAAVDRRIGGCPAPLVLSAEPLGR